MITITTIFATLAISKGAKLLDYSSVLSTFGTLFLCLITGFKVPGYHGCLCRMYTYVCNGSCNGSLCCDMAGVYFGNQINRLEVLQGGHTLCQRGVSLAE